MSECSKSVKLTLVEGGGFTEKVLVTPAMAKEWLGCNPANRRIVPSRVHSYSEMMKRGEWYFTHQGVAFYEDDTLADGQHRLMAVMRAGVPVVMNVTYGISKAAVCGIDTGRPKNIGNIMTVKGIEVKCRFVPIARALFEQYRLQRGTGTWRNIVDPDEFIRFCEAARPAVEFAIPSNSIKGIGHAVVRGAIAAAWYTADRDRLREFKDQLQSGLVSIAGDTAVMRLRDWLQTNKLGAGRLRHEIHKRTCTALIAYLARRQMSKLHATEASDFSIPELI